MHFNEFAKIVADNANENGADVPAYKVEKVAKAVFDSIKGIIESGDDITFNGFGAFKVVECDERIGTDPRNGKPMTIPAKKTARFYISKTWRNEMNGK